MDFPEIGSVWQKPVNGGEIIDTRRVTRFVRENYPANRPESQTAWVYYADRRGAVNRAALQDWRGWAKKATKIVDGQPTTEPEVVPVGGL
jgi:hypothetical protein